MNIRDGIQTFLSSRELESPFLIPKWNKDLESQFLVHEGNIEGEGSNTWTDGNEVWSHHRWPNNAGTNPNYKDRGLTFSPRVYLKRFGSTWWNFRTKRSVAVALDIDLEDGHAESTTTVDKSKLSQLQKQMESLNYLTVVRSSGGGGLHLYCFFDENHQPEAENHNEHSQVAHALVAKISDDLNYDLKQHMDAIGVVFWLWSCDSPEGHPGYELLQEQTISLKGSDLESYMKESLAGPNQDIKVEGYNDSGEKVSSTKQGGGYKVYPIEPEHSSILKELEDMGFDFIWCEKYNMAHTHTVAIKKLYEKREADGNPLKGIFKTISQGNNCKPNCYITPRENGSFQVKRFGVSPSEHPLWNNREGDTWCYLNQETAVMPIMKKFASSYDGQKLVFEAVELEKCMGVFDQTLGPAMSTIVAPIQVLLRKDGTLLAKFKGSGNYEGWTPAGDGFLRELPIVHKISEFRKSMLDEADQFVRNVITPDFEPYGWAIKSENHWILYNNYDPVSCVVQQAFGKDSGAARAEMTRQPWVMSHIPFGAEYPGDRHWNRNAPQLKVKPSEKPGPHPTWDRIFDHLGNSLDTAVASTQWCQEWGMNTGADYLRSWVSSMIHFPMEPLPYLFFYGPQDTGKSVFHESLATLFTSGVMSAKTALCSSAGYNEEIANVVLGFVEEKDLNTVKDGAYDRIKEWITAKTMQVHKKGHTPYNQPNTLHLVQMANKASACPMEDGDTRITAIMVSPLKNLIPKALFFKLLAEEAPFFLRTIMTTHIPETHDRLRVPMLSSEHKKDLESMNQTPFESFCSDTMIQCNGASIKFSDLYQKYVEYCTLRSDEPEKKNYVMQLLRNRGDKYVLGIRTGKQMHIGNVTFSTSRLPSKILVLSDKGRLVSSV